MELKAGLIFNKAVIYPHYHTVGIQFFIRFYSQPLQKQAAIRFDIAAARQLIIGVKQIGNEVGSKSSEKNLDFQ